MVPMLLAMPQGTVPVTKVSKVTDSSVMVRVILWTSTFKFVLFRVPVGNIRAFGNARDVFIDK